MRLSEISKDEFHKRLVDPRRADLEKLLKKFDDTARNTIGWRVDWSVWELDNNVITVTAYKPRTIPYSSATPEDVRDILWNMFIATEWEKKNDALITFEEEDENSITWEFELL